MLTVGQRIARDLAEQFYRWELRGRGWDVWPDRVSLEPPFRPFEGHFTSPRGVVDDGQIESLGSRFAKGVTRLFGMNAPAETEEDPEEIEEPFPEIQGDRENLVEIQIALPPDYQSPANVFEQFLFSIGYAREPVAFEVVGAAGELVVQVTTGRADAAAVRQQLRAFFPEAVLTEGEEHASKIFEERDGAVRIVDFGLEREFMVPIHNLKAMAADPLVAICGALDQLQAGEAGIFQVLLEPVRHAWAPSMIQAVTLGDGSPFFGNDPDLVSQTRAKVTRPLFAVVVRVATVAETEPRAAELLRALAGALRPLANVQGNQLIPLANDDREVGEQMEDLLRRQTRRSGMLLNSDELIALAHLPTAAVRAKSLRRALQRTRAAPRGLTATNDSVWIGDNLHEGVVSSVHLSLELRLNHCHILGGTGSGKSTLLGQLALQDIQKGHGIAVIDPHGDLIDALLPHVPKERLDDVILFDPSDSEYAIGFNPLSASSPREKELLATDFIAVMRQHTSSWGDQMSSLLGNAVLAFLHNSHTGTLPELRRFLVSPEFRARILKTVTNQEVEYFWEHEAGLANKTAVGSILVRLDELLRSESLLHILGQRANKLNFGEIMDTRKIFLARLSKGLIGQPNAYLLGGLLVSKFYQTTIARQSRQRHNRPPYMLLMDEAGELLTSTISEILVGARKYGLGLTLAHQSLRQLTGDDEVYGAVTGSCGTKICFQVGGDDARKMADEFGGFVAADLMNLNKLHAVARVGPRDASFNLQTRFIPEPEREPEEAYQDLLDRTRQRYGTPKAEIRKELEALREFLPKGKKADPFSDLVSKQKKARQERQPSDGEVVDPSPVAQTTPPPSTTDSTVPESTEPTRETEPEPPTAKKPAAESKPKSSGTKPEPPRPVQTTQDEEKAPAKPSKQPTEPESPREPEPEKRSLGKAESIKNALIQAAGGWGFSHQTEFELPGGKRADIVLSLRHRRIACEISATTTSEQEATHLVNCLSGGFDEIFCVCDATARRKKIETLLMDRLKPGQSQLFRFFTVRQAQVRLSDIGQELQKAPDNQAGDKAPPVQVILSDGELDATSKRMLQEIAERRKKGKKAKEGKQGED